MIKTQYLIQEFSNISFANIWIDQKSSRWTPVSVAINPINHSVVVLTTRKYEVPDD